MLENKKEVLEMLKSGREDFYIDEISPELLDDREVMLALVQNHGYSIDDLPEKYKNDEELLLSSDDDLLFTLASKELLDNPDFLLKLPWHTSQVDVIYDSCSERLKKDPEFIKKLLEEVEAGVPHEPDEDPASNLAEYIIDKDHSMVYPIWDYFFPKTTDSFLRNALRIDGNLLELTVDKIKDDEKFVKIAVTSAGQALQDASYRLKDDKNIVLAAVESDGAALLYASDRLKGDKDVVLAAIKNAGATILPYVSKELKDDKEVVLSAIRSQKYNMHFLSGMVLSYASERLKDDKEVVLEAINYSEGTALENASERLRDDYEVVLEATKEYFSRTFQFEEELFGCISPRIRSNKKYVLELLSYDGYNIKYVSNDLKMDIEVIDSAIKDINKSLNEGFSKGNDSLYSSSNGMSLAGALPEEKNNKEIVLEAINDTLGLAYYYCSKELQQDPEILNHVKELNPTIIEYVQKNS